MEMSAKSEFPSSVDVLISGIIHKVDVEYEWRPVCCPTCNCFGHKCPPKDLAVEDATSALPTHNERALPLAGAVDVDAGPPGLDSSQLEKVKEHGLAVPDEATTYLPASTNMEDGWKKQQRKSKNKWKAEVQLVSTKACSSSITMVRPQQDPVPMSARSSSSTSLFSDDGLDEGGELGSSSEDDLLEVGDTKIHQHMVRTAADLVIELPDMPPPKPAADLVSTAPQMASTKHAVNPGIWNIRGLVDPVRQVEARNLVRTHNLCCIGILETKVPAGRFEDISSRTVPGWLWISNYTFSPRGRIWVGWDPNRVKFDALLAHGQAIHGKLSDLSSGISFNLSVIYEEHTFGARRLLWADLVQLGSSWINCPWIVAGDFNAILDPSDRVGGSTAWIPSFDELKDCLAQAMLSDLRYVGYRHTWSASSGANRKIRKIDRVVVNGKWCQDFSFSEASFIAPGISDHTPMIVKIANPAFGRKPFKFFNFWMEHPNFRPLLNRAWSISTVGTPMYRLYSRLKAVKILLEQMNKDVFSDLSTRVAVARGALKTTQDAFRLDPLNVDLAEMEKTQLKQFYELRSQEESFFCQKSRIRWLKEGDLNT
ncbi:hypothetical protein BT93_B0217 [Corymbia citriodora subsp. variegata]|nr:hypothetical protein BT93_B0217 [Corymbia citriodora subsp. variegata]